MRSEITSGSGGISSNDSRKEDFDMNEKGGQDLSAAFIQLDVRSRASRANALKQESVTGPETPSFCAC